MTSLCYFYKLPPYRQVFLDSTLILPPHTRRILDCPYYLPFLIPIKTNLEQHTVMSGQDWGDEPGGKAKFCQGEQGAGNQLLCLLADPFSQQVS